MRDPGDARDDHVRRGGRLQRLPPAEYKQSQIDWTRAQKELDALVEKYRGKYDYDCIVPFSGGKDSTFTLYYLVTEYKAEAARRHSSTTASCGRARRTTSARSRSSASTYLQFRPNWKVVQKLMLESLKRKGDFCWHCHTGIFSLPDADRREVQCAADVLGRAERRIHQLLRLRRGTRRSTSGGSTASSTSASPPRTWSGMLDGTSTMRDLEPFPTRRSSELRKLNVRSVCLGQLHAVGRQAAGRS